MSDQRDSLAARRERRLEAEANLAIEGIYLTDEERALFDKMEEQGLSDEEQIVRLKEHFFATYRPTVPAE